MKVLKSKRLNFGKHAGACLVGLALSVGANAMDQGQGQGQNAQQEAKGEKATQTKDLSCPLAQAQAKIVCEAKPEACQNAEKQSAAVCQESKPEAGQHTQTKEVKQEKAVKQEKVAKQETPSQQTQSKEVKQEKVAKHETPSQQTQSQEVKQEKVAKHETPSQQTQSQEVRLEKVAKHETPSQQTQSQEVKLEKVAKQETPSQQTQTTSVVKQEAKQEQSTHAQAQVSACDKQEQVTKVEKQIVVEPEVCTHVHDIADFSIYADRSSMKMLNTVDGLANRNGDLQASNFMVRALKFGHKLSHKDHRTIDWNKTNFNNFAFEAITAHSVDAHHANWKNGYIGGSISDMEFKKAHLENIWFNGKLKNVDFRKAHLKNVSFYGSKLTKTKNVMKAGKMVNFNKAILEGVTFQGSDLRHATFSEATFYPSTRFENAHINFATQFVGAKFIDSSSNVHVITQQKAQRLDAKHQTFARAQSFDCTQILQSMQQL